VFSVFFSVDFPDSSAYLVVQSLVKATSPVRNLIRLKHYSIRTEKSDLSWILRYILFHKKRGGAPGIKYWRIPGR